MTAIVDQSTVTPVRKSITVHATVEHAFRVFTEEFDSWWPRSHHIGKSPMKRAIVEGRPGGRCYTEQEDGTDCDWGTVVVWEPPHRFEPDLAKSSEVEVRFTREADGSTRVDLEHRYLHRHGADANAVRTAIDSPGGWGGLLDLFAARVQQTT